MKRAWIQISLMILGLSCAVQVGADPIDMGGFQIQVEERQVDGMQPEQDQKDDDDEKQGGTVPAQEEITSVPASEAVQTEEGQDVGAQAGGSVPHIGQKETFSEEGQGEGDGAEMREQVEGVLGEEEMDLIPEMVQEEMILQESTETVQEESMGESVMQQEEQDEEGGSGAERTTEEGSENKTKGEENTKSRQKRRKRASIKKEKGETIRFVHDDIQRILGESALAVRLEGGEEICILSYAVNQTECGYRWEEGRLLPVDPPLCKGSNSLKIDVLLGDGGVISMEPWCFSCGVGPAML